MPTPAQIDALNELLETRTPVVVIETHDERRVIALFEAISKRSGREVWTWSVSRGLRVAHGLKLKLLDFDKGDGVDAKATQQLPEALQQVDRMQEPAIVAFLDVHPFLSNPLITRAMKELALKCEARGLQLAFVGHDVSVPEELAPYASRFDIEPMNIERVKLLFNEEMARQRSRSRADVSGCRDTLQSLLRHMVGLPESAVRHMVRLTLCDGQELAADLARVLLAKQGAIGAAELLVFEQNLPRLDEVAGMTALKRWLALRREPFLQPDTTGLPPPRGRAAARRARRGQEPECQGDCGIVAGAAVQDGLWRAVRQIPGRERTQAARGAARGRCDATLRAVDGRDRKGASPVGAVGATAIPVPVSACWARC